MASSVLPSFAAAVYRARAKAKAKLVRVIINQAPRDWRAAAFLLERSYADEYSRVSVERVEQIGDKTDENPLVILYDAQGQKLSDLLAFPVHKSMGQGHDTPAEAEAKQKRLLGQTTNAPEPEAKISDAGPPEIVDKRFTGRIRPEWKGNGK